MAKGASHAPCRNANESARMQARTHAHTHRRTHTFTRSLTLADKKSVPKRALRARRSLRRNVDANDAWHCLSSHPLLDCRLVLARFVYSNGAMRRLSLHNQVMFGSHKSLNRQQKYKSTKRFTHFKNIATNNSTIQRSKWQVVWTTPFFMSDHTLFLDSTA